jgi:hypothetical protein
VFAINFENIKNWNSAYMLISDYLVNSDSTVVDSSGTRKLVYLPTRYTNEYRFKIIEVTYITDLIGISTYREVKNRTDYYFLPSDSPVIVEFNNNFKE